MSTQNTPMRPAVTKLRRARRRGAMILEALIAIVLVLGLAALVGPRLIDQVSKGNQNSVVSDAGTIGLEIQQRNIENGVYPATMTPAEVTGIARPSDQNTVRWYFSATEGSPARNLRFQLCVQRTGNKGFAIYDSNAGVIASTKTGACAASISTWAAASDFN